MANGVQLATAYISLNVRTDDIKKQVSSALSAVGGEGRRVGSSIGSNLIAGLTDRMNGGGATAFFAPIGIAGVRWAVGAGKAIGTALRTAIISSVSLGLGAALLGATAALTSGLDRLKTIQRATVQLSLKLSPNEIKQVTKDIADVVKGTPIALDEALQAVPRALSAGIKPGKELSQYVQDIADAAASSGGQAGFGQIDIIFSQVLGKGKLMGEELMQLTENGVDLRSALKNAFNWDDKKLNAMVAKGKVGMKEIQTAVQKTYGGLSNKMGETFDGAMGNMKASVARLGANFIAALLGKKANEDPLKDFALGIGKVTEGLDKMGAWVDAHRDEIHSVFVKGAEGAKKLWSGVKTVWEWLGKAKTEMGELWDKAQDIGTKIASGFNTAKDAVSGFIDKIKDIWTNLKTWVVDKWEAVFGANSPIGKFMSWLGIGPATANAAPPSPSQALPPLADTPPGFTRSFGTPSGGYNSKGEWVPGPSSFNAGPMAVPQASSSGQVPYGLPPGTDTGGYGTGSAKTFPAWVMQIADAFGIKPSTYSEHQQDNRNEDGYAPNPNGLNRGIDWAGPVENLQKFADYLATIPGSMEQVIWQNPDTKRKTGIAGGKDVSGTGYYDDGTYAEHGGNDPNNIHVHTRQSMSIPAPIQGIPNDWFGGGNNFTDGGGVWGAGSATSDSIPAMLSNGEHVLTADEVKKMGGQGGVYNFRSALKNGLIPGFAPGGAVDPNTVTDAQNNVGSLNNAYAVAQAQMNELIQKGDASPSELLRAQQNMNKTKRELDNATSDLPTIMAGGTPPDRSKQSRVYDLTDQLGLLQQQLSEQKDAGTEIPYSQQLQQNYQLESLKKQREQAVGDLTGKGQAPDYGGDFVRSLGLIPAAAGSTTKAGTSSLAGFIDMGASVVNGVIDTGVNLANTAVSAAIAGAAAAGTFGAASAAAPAASMAASYGLQLLGNQGKTISNYWFGLAGIGADAALEIFSPFGVPRALGYDYAGMTPQLGIQEAALSTVEKMGTDAIQKHFAGQGGGPDVPGVATPPPSGPSSSGTMQMTVPNANATGQLGGSNPMQNQGNYNLDLFNPQNNTDPFGGGGAGGGNGGGGSWARGGHVGIYDNGGVLKPGQMAFNASRTPESILTKQQWNAMAANAGTKSKDSSPLVQNLYAQDMQDAIRQLEKVKRRDMMQYAGRP